MERNKCIFFDIDGVLNRKSQWKKPYSLCDECIRDFCGFIVSTDADLIIMSSWRSGFVSTMHDDNSPQIRELEQKFQEYGVRIADKTPILRGRPREKEIERFLYQHDKVRLWAVIDDDPEEYDRKIEGLYLIDCTKGFTSADSKRIKFFGLYAIFF